LKQILPVPLLDVLDLDYERGMKRLGRFRCLLEEFNPDIPICRQRRHSIQNRER
jgi:hypothetical protein